MCFIPHYLGSAPRIFAYTSFGQKSKGFNPLNDLPITTPEMARNWVRANAKKGADGIKFFGAEPESKDKK